MSYTTKAPHQLAFPCGIAHGGFPTTTQSSEADRELSVLDCVFIAMPLALPKGCR